VDDGRGTQVTAESALVSGTSILGSSGVWAVRVAGSCSPAGGNWGELLLAIYKAGDGPVGLCRSKLLSNNSLTDCRPGRMCRTTRAFRGDSCELRQLLTSHLCMRPRAKDAAASAHGALPSLSYFGVQGLTPRLHRVRARRLFARE
jgi:hypothetical protein